jgi:DNA-binding CsgD family transcriptional regulator
MIVEKNAGQSMNVPLGMIEAVLKIALQHTQSSHIDKYPRLTATFCDLFNSDGCVIAPLTNSNSFARDIFCVFDRQQRYPADRVQKILRSFTDARKSVSLLNAPNAGGPAIIGRAEFGEMLIYRHDVRRHFSGQDAQLAGVLWRSCGKQEPVAATANGTESFIGVPGAPRASQILEGLLDGLSEKQLALQLSISRHTVHTHVKKIYRQFAVNTRSELLVRCLNRGIESNESCNSVIANRHALDGVKIGKRLIEENHQVIATLGPVPTVIGCSANMPFG